MDNETRGLIGERAWESLGKLAEQFAYDGAEAWFRAHPHWLRERSNLPIALWEIEG